MPEIGADISIMGILKINMICRTCKRVKSVEEILVCTDHIEFVCSGCGKVARFGADDRMVIK
jgi:hypothetical protein